MKMCNRAFGGMTPVDVIKEYGFAGLLMVRAYLDRVEKQRIGAINKNELRPYSASHPVLD